jgi:hypothetical protein
MYLVNSIGPARNLFSDAKTGGSCHEAGHRQRWLKFDALRGPTGALLIGDAETVCAESAVRQRGPWRTFANYIPDGT